jgi:hypothetical protein
VVDHVDRHVLLAAEGLGQAEEDERDQNSSIRSKVPKIGYANSERSTTSATVTIIIATRKTAAAPARSRVSPSSAPLGRKSLGYSRKLNEDWA